VSWLENFVVATLMDLYYTPLSPRPGFGVPVGDLLPASAFQKTDFLAGEKT
jgi:hypothetical protein